MRVCQLGLVVSFAVMVSSCDQTPSTTSANGQHEDVADQIAQLRNQVSSLSITISGLQTQLNILENSYGAGKFDPTDNHFQRVDASSGVGSFAVSIQDVKQFGDGIRVVIDLGNLTSATFSGATLKMKYGPRMPAFNVSTYAADQANWEKQLQDKTEDITASLASGIGTL